MTIMCSRFEYTLYLAVNNSKHLGRFGSLFSFLLADMKTINLNGLFQNFDCKEQASEYNWPIAF